MEQDLMFSWGVLFLGIILSVIGFFLRLFEKGKIKTNKEKDKLLIYIGIISLTIMILGLLLILFHNKFISLNLT
ncbi:hypothetical protein KAR91_00925 [Candidatus Pacearchaeota archaeon]|nr:hypothetical protein [Candidatus Pacearchaeota archaeon]